MEGHARRWCHLVATNGNAGHCVERVGKRGVKGKEGEKGLRERGGEESAIGEKGSRASSKRGDAEDGVLSRVAGTHPKTLAFRRLPEARGPLEHGSEL